MGGEEYLSLTGHKVPRSKHTHVIIHHTVVSDENDTSPILWETLPDVYRNMRRLQTLRPDLGNDVPYNFLVYFMAKKNAMVICEGRGEDRSGAHTIGHNTAGIGIALAGNFHEDDVTGVEVAKRMYLLSGFLGWLRYAPIHPYYGTFSAMKNLGSMRPADRAVYLHQDFKNTACLGKPALPHLSQLAFTHPNAF